MEFIRGLYNLKPRHRGCAITIGKYDGIHLGHQAIIKKLTSKAKKLAIKSMIIFFEPLPSEYFSKKPYFERISSLREKLAVINTFGVDYVLCLPFNAEFAQTSADNFVVKTLINTLAVNYIVVGYDFNFGSKAPTKQGEKYKQGNFALLNKYAKQGYFKVAKVKPFTVNGIKVSSSQIYTALKQKDFATVQKLLGRPYALFGRVIAGTGLGRTLGFPTINLHIPHIALLLHGVFIVKVQHLTANSLYGIANVGFRPTIDGHNCKKIFEVHIFDYNANAYGKKVKVEILQKLRDETKFASLAQLRSQIAKDITQAKSIIAQNIGKLC